MARSFSAGQQSLPTVAGRIIECLGRKSQLMATPRWGPRKPREAIKVVRCSRGQWDEEDHGLDYPGVITTRDFRVTGTGHDLIARIYKEGCANRRTIAAFNGKQAEHRIAAWLCQHCISYVLFDTKPRSTVIGFEREEDAENFARQFVNSSVRSID
jgi:hypothetical protein